MYVSERIDDKFLAGQIDPCRRVILMHRILEKQLSTIGCGFKLLRLSFACEKFKDTISKERQNVNYLF